MLRTVLAHIRAQWAGFLALFLVIAGGTAYAANTIASSDIIDGQVRTADIGNNQVQSADVRDDTFTNGGLGTHDIANESLTTNDIAGQGIAPSDILMESLTGAQIAIGAISGSEVADESLTGADIANQSGVDNCTHGTVRYGELCVGIAGEAATWDNASSLCAGLELRLPSLGEARMLAQNYDLPGVFESEPFWTEETYVWPSSSKFESYTVSDDGYVGVALQQATASIVCVTTPTN